MACIICGETNPEKVQTHELAHGKIEVCYGGNCRRMIAGKVLGYYPIAGFCISEIFDAELFDNPEDLDSLTDEDEEQLASDMAVMFWN